ncbi:hypothetical protein DFQ30_005515 [Apophysomyces sp. BC1015]|nr:hypothetical protein DFQ30_005515 [Apophysomyces sp. BC1015]
MVPSSVKSFPGTISEDDSRKKPPAHTTDNHHRLYEILSSPQLLALFEEYLQRVQAHENLLFVEALSQLRHENNQLNVEKVVHRIWKTFIALGAPLELSIENSDQIGREIHAYRWDIMTKQKALQIFQDAERQVEAILEESVPSFDALYCQSTSGQISGPLQFQKKVVIIGGGFTGFTVASILDPMPRFHVTVIDTKGKLQRNVSHMYLMMSFKILLNTVLMLVRPEETSSLRVRHGAYVKNGRVVIGHAERLEKDATAVRVNNELIPFDYLVIATGSTYKSKLKSFDISALYRMSELATEHVQLKKSNSVLIIGGGLVGCELASEIALHNFPAPHLQKKHVTIVESHSTLVPRSSERRQEKAMDYLTKLGVDIICNERIVDFDSGETNAYLGTSGRVYRGYDKVYLATGTTPCSNLIRGDGDAGFESCIDHWDRIKVKPTLQLDHWKYKHIFAGGDVTNVCEEKTGYAATLAGVCIARNICRLEKGKPPLRQGAKGTVPAPPKPLHGLPSHGGIGRQQLGLFKKTFAFLNPNWAALKSFDEQQFLRIVQGEAAASSLAIGKMPKYLEAPCPNMNRPINRLRKERENDFNASRISATSLSGSDILSLQGNDDAESIRSFLLTPGSYELNVSFETFSENSSIRSSNCSSDLSSPDRASYMDKFQRSVSPVPQTKTVRHVGSMVSLGSRETYPVRRHPKMNASISTPITYPFYNERFSNELR